MLVTSQPAWRDWATNFPATARENKPNRDRWLKKHGFETEAMPIGDDDQGENEQ